MKTDIQLHAECWEKVYRQVQVPIWGQMRILLADRHIDQVSFQLGIMQNQIDTQICIRVQMHICPSMDEN
jgi:hypothetical protein